VEAGIPHNCGRIITVRPDRGTSPTAHSTRASARRNPNFVTQTSNLNDGVPAVWSCRSFASGIVKRLVQSSSTLLRTMRPNGVGNAQFPSNFAVERHRAAASVA